MACPPVDACSPGYENTPALPQGMSAMQRLSNLIRASGVLFFIATLCVGAVTLWRAFDTWSFMRNSTLVVAKTVELERIPVYSKPGVDLTNFAIVVEFKDEKENVHRARAPQMFEYPPDLAS